MKSPLTYYFFAILCCLPMFAKTQLITISGIVSDGKKGHIIESANVFDKNSTIGTISNKFGFYKLMLSPGKIDLLVSCDGFSDYTQKFELKSDSTFAIVLKPVHHFKGKQKDEAEFQALEKNEAKKAYQQVVKQED